MAFALLADVAASITELKRNPMRVIREGAGEAVVILHRNKPAFYAVPPALYEAMLEVVDDAHLAEVVRTRRGESTVREALLPFHTSKLRVDETELTFLTLDECRLVLAECARSTNSHTLPVAKLCLTTGARWDEAESITRNQLVNGQVRFARTKNGRVRSIPVPPNLLKLILDRGYPGSGRLFSSCRSAFRKAYERTGLHTPGQLTHILRHTFASHYMMQGGNILTLQRILGHGDIKMTMRYSHLAPDHFATALTMSPLALLDRSQDQGL